MILSSDFMYYLFNVHIRRLSFFCIHNMNVVVFENFHCFAFNLVGIKYQDQRIVLEPLIIAKHIHQFISCCFNILFCQFFQIIPCENNIITIYQQIFLYTFFIFLCFWRFPCSHSLWKTIGFSLYPSVSPDKNLFQFPVFSGITRIMPAASGCCFC